MDSEIILSIVIPTYNRAKFIGDAISSVINQLNDSNRNKIEIVISDNASEDNTEEVVRQFAKDVKLAYSRNPENLGYDRNILKCAELASGKYIMSMGDDDKITEGSIDYILSEVSSDYEIYISDRYLCDINMNIFQEQHYTNYPREKQLFDLKKDSDLIEYFNSVNTIAGVFSFMSSNIVKKSSWDKVIKNEKYIGSMYTHVCYIFNFLKQEKCRLKYLDKIIPMARCENDSFLKDNSYLKRVIIDFDCYEMLAEEFFSNNKPVKTALLKILTRDHLIHNMMSVIIMSNSKKEEWEHFRHLFGKFPYPFWQRHLIKYFNFYGRFYYMYLYLYYKFFKRIPRVKLSKLFQKKFCYTE